jgi:hypothetical protein
MSGWEQRAQVALEAALASLAGERESRGRMTHLRHARAEWAKLLPSDVIELVCLCCSRFDAVRLKQAFDTPLGSIEPDAFVALSPFTLLESRTWVQVVLLITVANLSHPQRLLYSRATPTSLSEA